VHIKSKKQVLVGILLQVRIKSEILVSLRSVAVCPLT